MTGLFICNLTPRHPA